MRDRFAAVLIVFAMHACTVTPGHPATGSSASPPSALASNAANPFAHLADAMANDCIGSATNPHVAHAVVYTRCIAARNALLNAAAPKRYADDDAVTASILGIYAAFALRQSAPRNASEFAALLRESNRRLTALAKTSERSETRHRAAAAKSCLIDRDAECLAKWAQYQ